MSNVTRAISLCLQNVPAWMTGKQLKAIKAYTVLFSKSGCPCYGFKCSSPDIYFLAINPKGQPTLDPDQQRIIVAFDNYGNINSAAQDVKSGFFITGIVPLEVKFYLAFRDQSPSN